MFHYYEIYFFVKQFFLHLGYVYLLPSVIYIVMRPPKKYYCSSFHYFFIK